jgi:probable HAF family extracellular repeat protein
MRNRALLSWLVVVTSGATVGSISPAAADPMFMDLGTLGGYGSIADDVSADGSAVVGNSFNGSQSEAFRWTSSSGMVGLGILPGMFSSNAAATSADGSVVAGENRFGFGATGEAFRWTAGGGMIGLGDLPGGAFDSTATDISADGSVIVGAGKSSASGSNYEAFRWTSGSGMVGLGDLPGGIFLSVAAAVSPDGSVVVGRGSSVSGSEAIRWTSGGGMVGLGDLPGGAFGSAALGISADGSVIVGQGTSASGLEAFRWTAGGGMIGLGDLPTGAFQSKANAVSADGSVIVGESYAGPGIRAAFIWDETNGMRRLDTVLSVDLGLDLTDWELLSAEGISADGRTIVGTGYNPIHGAFIASWIAVIPEPDTALLVMTGLLGLAYRQRRQGRAA